VLVVYGRRHEPFGVECRLSTDSGVTWSRPLLLAWTATNADCGYPSAVVLDDGTILMLWYAIGSVNDKDLRWHCEALRFREEDVTGSLETAGVSQSVDLARGILSENGSRRLSNRRIRWFRIPG
jgi:hypothetical protein